MWGQKAPPKHENGAKSASKTTKWGQKAPPLKSGLKKCGGKKHRQNAKVGGEKRRQNSKVTAKSATTQIREEKDMVAESAIKMEKWWRKMPSKQQSDGRKCHYISNCGGTSATIPIIVVVH